MPFANPVHLDSPGKMRQAARLFAALKGLADFDTYYVPSPHDGVICVGSIFRSGAQRYQAFTGVGETGKWVGEFSSATNALAFIQASAPGGDPSISLVLE
jgi:hypothetical protein